MKNIIIFIFSLTVSWAFAIPAQAEIVSIEKNGRWLSINNSYSYLVGMDAQRLVSWIDIDYIVALDALQMYRINYIRVWIEPVYLNPDESEKTHIHPYLFGGQSGYNLDAWNSAYWNRLGNIVDAARERDIIVCVSVFNVLMADFSKSTQFSPFDESINMNGRFDPSGSSILMPEWYDLNYTQDNSSLAFFQQKLLDKTLETVGDRANVIVEIQNENGYDNNTDTVTDDFSAAWQNHWADYAKTKISGLTALPPSVTKALVEVHGHYKSGDTRTFDGMTIQGVNKYWNKPYIDILNFHFYSGEPDIIGERLHLAQDKGKVLFDNEGYSARNIDTGSIDSPVLNSSMRNNWGMFTTGGYGALFNYSRFDNLINDGVWQIIANRLTVQRNIVETLRFWDLSPVDDNNVEYDALVTSGPARKWQVIANPGSEYAIYFWGGNNTSTETTIDLLPGDYIFTWYSPAVSSMPGQPSTLEDSLLSFGQVAGESATKIPAPDPNAWQNEAGLILTLKLNPAPP